MTTAMDALLKAAVEGLDEDVVPKVTKTTTEETTSFVRFDSEEEKVDTKRKNENGSTSNAKKTKTVSTLNEKVEEVVEAPERKDETKEGHPEQRRLPEEEENPPPPGPCVITYLHSTPLRFTPPLKQTLQKAIPSRSRKASSREFPIPVPSWLFARSASAVCEKRTGIED